MRIELLNEQHVRIQLDNGIDVIAVEQHIRSTLGPICYDIIVAYHNLLLHINPGLATIFEVEERLQKSLLHIPERNCTNEQDIIEIPVCYDIAYAPDLEDVARHCRLSIDEVTQLHSAKIYHVVAMGFSPGFAYLGDLDARLDIARLDNPRKNVSAGSVAIAAGQTAVYPIDSPGGWRIIGRTPRPLVHYHENPMSPLSLQKRVRFIPMTRAAFDGYRNQGS